MFIPSSRHAGTLPSYLCFFTQPCMPSLHAQLAAFLLLPLQFELHDVLELQQASVAAGRPQQKQSPALYCGGYW